MNQTAQYFSGQAAEKPLRIAFIADPLPELKAYKDSTVAMMRAGQRRGHMVFAIDAASLAWERPIRPGETGVAGEAVGLQLDDDDSAWYRETGRERLPLTAFDAVVMRKDPPFDFEYLTATWLLERAEAEGARIINRPSALRDHSEKLSILEFPEFAPLTAVARDMARIHRFIDAEGDVILKPLDGMGGSQIFRVDRHDPNRNVIVETLTQEGRRTIMAQRFLPEIADGDKRILLIGGQPVPWCLARIPKAGETRGNLAVGGTGVTRELSAADRRIAEALGPVLLARGLMLVGLDVIGDRLTEINVTSPTCMVEIAQQRGFDAAGMFIAAVERACGGA